MKKLFKKIGGALDWLIRKPPVSTIMSVCIAVLSIWTGGAMIFNPDAFRNNPAFRFALEAVSPPVIGVLLVGISALLIWSLWKKKHDLSHYAALALGLLYFALAFLVSPALVGGHTEAPVGLYLFVGFMCLLVQRAYQEGVHNVEADGVVRK